MHESRHMQEAIQTGLEYARQALSAHDAQYGRHPAMEADRKLIVDDIASIESAFIQLNPTSETGRWHVLKTDPDVFDAVAAGLKTHEIRLNDRDFKVGDGLILRRTQHSGQDMAAGAPLSYTGQVCRKLVSHVLTGYGLAEGWVVLSLASEARASQAAAGAATAADLATQSYDREAEFNLICQAIDKADSLTMEGDYMLDSNDCIRVVRVMQALLDVSRPGRATPVRLKAHRAGRVYLAGPMTGIEDYNFPAFYEEAAELEAMGLTVVNPADHGIVNGAEWFDYLRHDIAGLASCEQLHLLRGWTKSRGATLEVLIANALGMAISYQEGAEPPPATEGSQMLPIHTHLLASLAKDLRACIENEPYAFARSITVPKETLIRAAFSLYECAAREISTAQNHGSIKNA